MCFPVCPSAALVRNLSATAMVCLVSACGGSDSQSSQTLMRAVEYRQCEPRVPTMAQLDTELQAAGVEVRANSCAWYGLQGAAAACGTPSILLRVIEVSEDQTSLVAPLGYRPKTDFPASTALPCPTQ